MNSPDEERAYVKRMVTEFRELLISYGANERVQMLDQATQGLCARCGLDLTPGATCDCVLEDEEEAAAFRAPPPTRAAWRRSRTSPGSPMNCS